MKPNRNPCMQGLRNMLADESHFLPTVDVAIDFLLVIHVSDFASEQYWEQHVRLPDLPGLRQNLPDSRLINVGFHFRRLRINCEDATDRTLVAGFVVGVASYVQRYRRAEIVALDM